MAIRDDDFNKVWFRITLGGNGDYYPELIWEDKDGIRHFKTIRICTSGSKIDVDVRIKIAELYRQMEKLGLNEYPDDEE